MGESQPTSVLLPTVTWGEACDQVAGQLGPDDELLVICDTADDPVHDRTEALPDGVRVVAAGEPEGCSGKANAIAAGMEAAANDRIVWSDDDFDHPPEWLAGLQTDYERQGPTTELPVFVGRDPLAWLLEPLHLLSGTLPVYAAGVAWGGSLIFDRSDLDDEDAFLADLRRTISDDGTLMEYIDMGSVKRTRRVAVGGTVRETLERYVRFTQIAFRHSPLGVSVAALIGTLVTVAVLLHPILGAIASTVAFGALYAFFGVRRWTVLLAFPVTVLQIPLFVYGLARRTFVWGGRRYRWHSKYDVAVLD